MASPPTQVARIRVSHADFLQAMQIRRMRNEANTRKLHENPVQFSTEVVFEKLDDSYRNSTLLMSGIRDDPQDTSRLTVDRSLNAEFHGRSASIERAQNLAGWPPRIPQTVWKKKVGRVRHKARYCGRSSPDSSACEPAKRPVDRADYCLGCISIHYCEATRFYSRMISSPARKTNWLKGGPNP